MLSSEDLSILCQKAKEAAIEAGQYIQSQIDQHNKVHKKTAGASLASQVVTAVDINAEGIILQHLQDTLDLYDIGLLTEETTDDKSRLKKPYFWCIDPLDGTLAFTKGRTGYAVSIALVAQEGYPLIGVVYVPDFKDCYSAIKSEGVYLNNKPFIFPAEGHYNSLHLYIDSSLQQTPYYERLKQQLEVWAQDRKLVIQIHIGFGAVRNAIGAMQSPLGAYFKFPKQQPGGGSVWDYAATCLFFEELGLWVTNSSGYKLHLNNSHTSLILYATDLSLSDLIKSMDEDLKNN